MGQRAPPEIGRERIMREVEEWRNIQVVKYRFLHVCVYTSISAILVGILDSSSIIVSINVRKPYASPIATP